MTSLSSAVTKPQGSRRYRNRGEKGGEGGFYQRREKGVLLLRAKHRREEKKPPPRRSYPSLDKSGGGRLFLSPGPKRTLLLFLAEEFYHSLPRKRLFDRRLRRQVAIG